MTMDSFVQPQLLKPFTYKARKIFHEIWAIEFLSRPLSSVKGVLDQQNTDLVSYHLINLQ